MIFHKLFVNVRKTPFQKWNLLLTEDIIEEIINCTNYLQSIRRNFSRIRHVTDIDVDEDEEVKPLCDILYMARIFKSNHTNLSDIHICTTIF